MMRLIVGIFCAGLSVFLLFYSVWLSTGGTRGMPSMIAGLGLLLVAVMTLRPGGTRRASR